LCAISCALGATLLDVSSGWEVAVSGISFAPRVENGRLEAQRGVERGTNPEPGAGGRAVERRRLVLSVTEAAEILGISRAFAYELVARGHLPHIRLGRRIVVPHVQLDRLLEGRDAHETA
jgi:excisionase family DNA binding protein